MTDGAEMKAERATAEAIDSFEALDELSVEDREIFQDALRTTMVKRGEEVPTFEQLRDLMLRDHPALARLRADYAVVEKQLRLEIANQYPDLEADRAQALCHALGAFRVGNSRPDQVLFLLTILGDFRLDLDGIGRLFLKNARRKLE